MVDPGENVSVTVRREFMEEALVIIQSTLKNYVFAKYLFLFILFADHSVNFYVSNHRIPVEVEPVPKN